MVGQGGLEPHSYAVPCISLRCTNWFAARWAGHQERLPPTSGRVRSTGRYLGTRWLVRRSALACPFLQAQVFSQTETCLVLWLVNGSRFQPLQRSRSVIPASRAIRSSSDGQT